ncbi:MAG: nitrous oxide reductase accessory protein NosL [Saprospiraceae bacterium]
MKLNTILSFAFALILMGCSEAVPDRIQINRDKCDYCKMSISDLKFSTALLTQKGRTYKFDDLSCMINYKNTMENSNTAKFFVSEFNSGNALINAESAFFVYNENLKSPMGGNFAALSTKEKADVLAMNPGSEILTWKLLNAK